MFDAELEKYTTRGSFNFKPSEIFRNKCDAPRDKGGIYLIFKIVDDQEILIYIGSSGQRKEDGTLKVRRGGMHDRLINGYHPNRFGEPKRIKRHNAFPKQMIKEGIPEIKVYWWVTYDDTVTDFPTNVESRLREKYLTSFHKLPDWHSQ